MGISGVLGGLLHALLIPEHGLSLLALGLALGQQERTASRSGLLVFVAALTCGLVITAFIVEPALAGDILLAITGILACSLLPHGCHRSSAGLWRPLQLWPLRLIRGQR